MNEDVPEARFSTATVDWAREEHDMLGRHRRIDTERLRARLVSRTLSLSVARMLAYFR
ncbi:hypothetical protein [Haladaptatus caseinilyticus]|uniref:hypothetical protein n=1 Tax=Haladaptatus caseinilyticus TaxID=2993314 RepID=UPI00224B5931|nr:hypothetical protein [Haladaptatus caseinilyticus]